MSIVQNNLVPLNVLSKSESTGSVTNRPAFKQQVVYPDKEDEFVRQQKKQKRKNSIISGIMVGGTLLMAIFFGRALVKDIKADKLAKKMSEEGGPTAAQRELGVKTREELASLFTDVSDAKSFKDIKMSPELRDELNNIMDKIKNAETYEKYLQEINNAILLYGPPGTGKTTFVKALCKELGVTPFIYDMGVLKGGFQGTTESNMKAASEVFLAEHRAARAKDPKHISIMFFDECDEVFQKAVGPNKDSDNQILTRFKRCFDDWKKEPGVFIFGNTNKMPYELDDAIANRMYKSYIPCPNAESLSENFFNHYKTGEKAYIADDLKNPSAKSDKFFAILARDGRQFSYRDLENVGWKDGSIENKSAPLTFNDIIQRAIDSAEPLRITKAEVEELKALLK